MTKYNLKTEIRVWDAKKNRYIKRVRTTPFPLDFDRLFEKMRIQLELYQPNQVRFTVSIADK